MAGVSVLKLVLLDLIGTIAGAGVGILLRPSYPIDSHLYPELNKPTLLMMFQNGIPGTNPTDRTALIYLIVGATLGGFIGALLTFVTSAKKAQRLS